MQSQYYIREIHQAMGWFMKHVDTFYWFSTKMLLDWYFHLSSCVLWQKLFLQNEYSLNMLGSLKHPLCVLLFYHNDIFLKQIWSFRIVREIMLLILFPIQSSVRNYNFLPWLRILCRRQTNQKPCCDIFVQLQQFDMWNWELPYQNKTQQSENSLHIVRLFFILL